MKVALIAGSTGLIGNQLLQLLLADQHYEKVIALSRKHLEIKNPKLVNLILNFDQLATYAGQLTADDVFCCLGTTMKQAGSKKAFWKVDHDYAVELAKVTRNNGASQYLLVSALGADVKSSFYYNEVKARTEEDIKPIGFDAYHIFRPSLLLGPRDEQRAGEDAAKIFYRLFNFLIPKKYKAIDSAKVARAMVHYAKRNEKGVFIHSSADLQPF
jgi:uncharacterized protein YbjT (DUF2867 family)